MYRVELWRQEPPVLLVKYVVEDQASFSWTPQGGELPAGWPRGYEWRSIPLPGSKVPAATWPADWR